MKFDVSGGSYAAVFRAICRTLNRFQRRTCSLVMSGVILCAFSFAQAATATPGTDVPEGDLIHYGDLIDVDVIGNLEYDWRGTVNPEGFLDGLALATEPVYALCKSESALADELTAQYSRTLKSPKIVVKILDRSNRAATLLLGAVRTQQRFRIKRRARLNELLALSGGITDTANGEVTIFRPGDLNCFPRTGDGAAKSSMIRVKLSQLLTGDLDANPVILSGDVVTVVEASPIYVIGGVNTPRQLSSRNELTVSRAVLSAGGLSKEAVESDVTIYRRDGKDTRTISVDLKKIFAKQQDDIVLKPFDIVDVGQRGRAKTKFAPSLLSDVADRDIYKLPVRIIE